MSQMYRARSSETAGRPYEDRELDYLLPEWLVTLKNYFQKNYHEEYSNEARG